MDFALMYMHNIYCNLALQGKEDSRLMSFVMLSRRNARDKVGIPLALRDPGARVWNDI